ncbi:uncharacterized protein G2W53_032034 [Senna tora]|uniref:Uncharacterized protein n=1 Tax=Senna tora TaxID=362788 RepID=A0A834SV32_9FABA|nr:uncharacterized protein G2W53_032034 [Senna tora]
MKVNSMRMSRDREESGKLMPRKNEEDGPKMGALLYFSLGLSESNTSLFAEFTSSCGELVLVGTPSHGMDSTGLLEPTVMALFHDDETERARAWYGYRR